MTTAPDLPPGLRPYPWVRVGLFWAAALGLCVMCVKEAFQLLKG
jgi:hypothetical protein